MADAKSKSRKPRKAPRRPQYKFHPGSVSVTVHSPDGSPVASEILDKIVHEATLIAITNKLLVNVAKA